MFFKVRKTTIGFGFYFLDYYKYYIYNKSDPSDVRGMGDISNMNREKYFRVRFNPEEHRKVKLFSALSGKTMQQYMYEAAKEKMEREKERLEIILSGEEGRRS